MLRIARQRPVTLNLPTLRLEGALFLPDMLEKAALGHAPLQADPDYRLPKGLKQKDEFSRAFQIASAQWRYFEKQQERKDIDAYQATVTFVGELLRDAFAYPVVSPVQGVDHEDRHYPITHMISDGHELQLPVVIVPHSQGLDVADTRYGLRHPDGTAVGVRKKSPFQLCQELLNAHHRFQWGLVSNGKTIRLLRDAATLTRPSYLDIDLADLLSGQRYSEFAYAWRLLHASRATTVWEAWREAGQLEGTRVRNGLRVGVTQALLVLGNGFIQNPANSALRAALHEGTLSKEDYFSQLLRLVYRLIFLFSIEERGLLPTNSIYSQGYAMARLRDLSLRRRARTRFEDLWQSVKVVFTGLAAGEPKLGLPALGGLFQPSQCQSLDSSELSNAHLLEAIQHLRWHVQAGGTLAPVDYRNMGVEELGSVYESLLELVPEIDLSAKTFGFIGLTTAGSTSGNERKTTGSYYTPDSLVQELIQSALVPVIEDRISRQADNPADAILSIKVCDPACGSGHFLLAAARKLAEKLAELRTDDGVVTPHAYRHALREVIGRCIFGVDRNPMAIELARTALWLEGYEEGRALNFLDHHLQIGDALLGLSDLRVLEKGISKDAFKALSGDDKEVCKVLSKANAVGLKQMQKQFQSGQMGLNFTAAIGLEALRAIEAMPADTPQQVELKAAAFQEFLQASHENPVAHAADLLLAAYLTPKTRENLSVASTSQALFLELSAQATDQDHLAIRSAAQRICQEARVFHWPLAFPQVFSAGGFDCVLANPPWERIKLQEEEFFATRHPAIAESKNKAERVKRITLLSQGLLANHLGGISDPSLEAQSSLAESERRLYAEFINARRAAEASSVFVHVDHDEGGRYPLTGVGDVNTYALFSETILQLTAESGRSGFIVPTGIATDDSTKLFFGHISQTGRLVSLFDIENRDKLFEAVDSRMKFSLITLGKSEKAEFVCFATQPDQIYDSRRRFSLTPEEFRLLNPNTLTCPMFRSERDAEITKKIYRAAPVLMLDEIVEGEGQAGRVVQAGSNPWGVRFSTMFHMANDSHLFYDSPANDRLPLYEAKLIHQFDHRWATYTPEGESRDMTLAEKQDPNQTVRPRYWVDQREVWLRVANLPAGLLKALRDGDEQGIILGVTWFLFGVTMRTSPELPVYPAWKRFIKTHPFAAEIPPTSMGICGRNPPCLKPIDENYLPAQGEFAVEMSNERESAAWYAVDQHALQTMLKSLEMFEYPLDTIPALQTRDDALHFAEVLLEQSCPKWLMGWRDVTNATNERTVISTVFSLSGVGHTLPLLFSSHKPGTSTALLANLGSLTLDFIARVKVGGMHLTYGYLKQFAVLPPETYGGIELAFITPRVLELVYTAPDLATWAKEIGYVGHQFKFDTNRRAVLRAELDAYYAKLYGLTRDELRYILDPTDVMGEDYPSETFRVLKNKEIAEFGEYRTRRLVLEAWDALE